MATFKDWLLNVAFTLNDDEPGHEFSRYPVKNLVGAYNDALCLIAKYRPDLFTEYEILKLQPGKYQDARCVGCSNIFSVSDQTTEDGAVLKELSNNKRSLTKVKSNWKKPSCLNNPKTDFNLNGASIDNNMNGRFTVDPAVPKDKDVYVRVKCVKRPCPMSPADLNRSFDGGCDMNVAAKHYVIATMLMGDRFSRTSSEEVLLNYRMFYQVLGINLQQEQLFELGELGGIASNGKQTSTKL